MDRRCELCGARMPESVRADVEAARRYKLVYLDPDDSRFVYAVCDDYWQRHLDILPVAERERERRRERCREELTVESRAWLERAPVGPERIWDGDEVLSMEEAVQQCVGSLEFGTGGASFTFNPWNGRLPPGYRRSLRRRIMTAGMAGDEWAGSVFRTRDGRIVLRWEYVRDFDLG